MNLNKTTAHQLDQIAEHQLKQIAEPQLSHQSAPLKVWDAAIVYIPFNEMAKLVYNPKEHRFLKGVLE